MTPYLQIKKHINKALKSKRLLNPMETYEVLNHLKNVSEEKILLENLMSHIIYLKDKSASLSSLTKRELQVLKLIGCNFKSSEISITLSISYNTVATHRKNIIKKLGLKGTRQLKVTANEYVKSDKN